METPSKPTLTYSQLKAVKKLDSPLVATAGPGAGKTRVLVNRYLEILSQPNTDIDNIVAITFTTKAANEMRERVQQGIEELIKLHKGTIAGSTWQEYKRRLSSGVITTIHGFCSRLLREHPIEAQVDPYFSILDEYTSSLMLDTSIEEAVNALIDSDEEEAVHLVAAYGRTQLMDELARLYIRLRGLGVEINCIKSVEAPSLDATQKYYESVDKVNKCIAKFIDIDGITDKAREKISDFLKSCEQFKHIFTIEPLPENGSIYIEAIEKLRRLIPDARSKSTREVVTELRELLGHHSVGQGKLVESFFEVCGIHYQQLLLNTLKHIDSLYTESKHSVQSLDYEDLQLFTRKLLVDFPEIRRRIASHYKHFLVDEFQDTNQLQKEIVGLLTLNSEIFKPGLHSFFIVGDRKQSIYNFRGAEVEVFQETIDEVVKQGGEHLKLDVNFRSDPRLVEFFNYFFSKLMYPKPDTELVELRQLGFIEHEPNIASRDLITDDPAIEFLCYWKDLKEEENITDTDDESLREIEARRLAARLQKIVRDKEPLVLNAEKTEFRSAKYGDIALLLSTFTQVKIYEQAFQRAEIPYYVIAGSGFYSRPEIVDLLMLLEFIDNSTDEISLASILRSPLFGISDETLFALRWSDENGELIVPEPNQKKNFDRLFSTVLAHQKIRSISTTQHKLLQQAAEILQDLISVRNQLSISQLLERAIHLTKYDVVTAAYEDGPQRLSNIDKLVSRARVFEKRQVHLLRDFVEYVRNFKRLETREAEAQLELGLNAVALLTIHKSKGLEFPIVVIPDLQHTKHRKEDGFLYDREYGIGCRIPDQRGGLVETTTYASIKQRSTLRSRFESIRQLYVGMTRARDYLILSCASKKPRRSEKSLQDRDNWLYWVCEILDAYDCDDEVITTCGKSSVRILGKNVDINFAVDNWQIENKPIELANNTINVLQRRQAKAALKAQLEKQISPVFANVDGILSSFHYRFNVTQLVNFLNCPKQYYFSRILQVPEISLSTQQIVDSENREGKAKLSASLRGTIIHRFCEIFRSQLDPRNTLRKAIEDIRSKQTNENVSELNYISTDTIVEDLWPLAKNYLESTLFQKIDKYLQADHNNYSVISELNFSLRTEAGMVIGSIDKLLVDSNCDGLQVHIIDFKTNTLWQSYSGYDLELAEKAAMYRIQMQSYALAVWKLLPNVKSIKATLHFLHPNLEYHFPFDQISEEASRLAVLNVMKKIRSIRISEPFTFEANPGARCINCRFNNICSDAIQM